MQFVATVVITTKDRQADLKVAISSALGQTAPIEVLVLDDGSSDGTWDMVRREFPAVRIERSDRSLGYVVQRNRGALLASAPIIVSIDDDAAFSTATTIEAALKAFRNPHIGAVAIPYVDIRRGYTIKQAPPSCIGQYVVNSYVGTAHAVRRDLFLRLGGYRGFLFHQGEESDFCIRLLDAGYFVGLVKADPIYHFESPNRNVERMDVFGRRNDVLFAWYNVPLVDLPLHLLGTTMKGVWFGLWQGRLTPMLRGIWQGYRDIGRQLTKRQPVRRDTYRLSRKLKKRGPLLEKELVPLSRIQ